MLCSGYMPYFYGYRYKTEFFHLQNKPENLDLSYKMDLDFWDCLGRAELVFLQNFVGMV